MDTNLSASCFNNSCQKPDKLRFATIHSFLKFRECFGWSVKKSGCPDGSYVVTVWLTPCKSRFVGLSLKDPPPSCKVATCCFSPCCIKFVSKLFQSCIRVVSKLSQSCLKVVSELFQSCLKVASLWKIPHLLWKWQLVLSLPVVPKLFQSCLKVVSELFQSCL